MAKITSTSTSYRRSDDTSHEPSSRTTLDVPARVVVKVLLIVALFSLAVHIVTELSGLIVQIAVAAFLAIAADPLIRRMERRGVGRGKAVGVVMFGAFALMGLVFAVFIPPLVSQGDHLIDAAPGIVRDVQSSELYEQVDQRFGIVETLSNQAAKLPGKVGNQVGTVFGAIAAGVIGTITILFLTIFLLLGGGQVVEGTVRLFPQLAERKWWTIVQGAYTGISAYVGGAIVIALIGGTVMMITAFALGLPYALPLGLWMMFLEIIPMIGATIGAIPAVIVAFTAGGLFEGLTMVTVVVVYQQFENIFVQPRVQGKAASLSPLVVFVSVLVGSQLLGVLGALFAVPVAGVVQIFLRQVIEEQGSGALALPTLGHEVIPPPDADGDGEPGVASDPWVAPTDPSDSASDDGA